MSLCNFFHYSIKSLPGYQKRKLHIFGKETSVCMQQKASYTIEAAILFPIAAGFLVSILFFFRILQVQSSVEQALVYAGKKTALESSFVNSEHTLMLSAKTFFLYAWEKIGTSDTDIVGGSFGLSLANSEISEDEIVLNVSYYMKLPISLFGKQYFFIKQEKHFRKWIGEYETDGNNQAETAYVYVTENGSVYHKTNTCRSLNLDVQQTAIAEIEKLRGYDGQKYYPCSMCSEKKNVKHVYYTNYGHLYHADIGCSAIKRTIKKIALAEVGIKTPCKYCYK